MSEFFLTRLIDFNRLYKVKKKRAYFANKNTNSL